MKFETLLLKALFIASLALCLGVIGSMLVLPHTTAAFAHAPVAAAAGRLPA